MKTSVLLFLLMLPSLLLAQRPTHSPGPSSNSPVDLTSWFDVIVFIVLPIVMIVMYFLYRKQLKQNKNDNEN